MKYRKYNRILSILSLFIFVILGIMVRNSYEGILFDVAILEYINSYTNPVILAAMKFISFTGSGYFLVPILAIAIISSLHKKKYYLSKILLAASLGSWVLNYILKLLINRSRPFDYFLVEQGGLSYPSGHSMVSMSMYLTFAYLISKGKLFKSKKTLIYTLALMNVILMGISRMYLGVHWPTDIIGGFIMGYIYFQTMVSIIKE